MAKNREDNARKIMPKRSGSDYQTVTDPFISDSIPELGIKPGNLGPLPKVEKIIVSVCSFILLKGSEALDLGTGIAYIIS